MNPYAKPLIFAIITFLGIFTHIGFDTHKKTLFQMDPGRLGNAHHHRFRTLLLRREMKRQFPAVKHNGKAVSAENPEIKRQTV